MSSLPVVSPQHCHIPTSQTVSMTTSLTNILKMNYTTNNRINNLLTTQNTIQVIDTAKVQVSILGTVTGIFVLLKNCPRIKIFRKFLSYGIKFFVLGQKNFVLGQ